jgi:nucleotide-binding universal stress UspA family protein
MKVVLAVDGTKFSKGVVEAAGRLRFEPGSELIVATVVDMGLPVSIDIFSGYLPSAEEAEAKARDYADKVLADTIAELDGKLGPENPMITPRVFFGSPDSRIVEVAEETDADLVIVGSHGYNRWEKLLLGSVSDSIVHHAPCSVMVVRG